MNSSELYSEHLKRVSRSFAFCIERLQPPFRDWVALSYILCRLVDTVEDSLWNSKTEQRQSFLDFENFIRGPVSAEAVDVWRRGFPTSIPDGEKKLLDDAKVFFEDLQSLPTAVRSSIQRTVLDMCRGMAHFSQGENKGIEVTTLVEANQYCFFVAGIIGELLTELFAESQPNYSLTDEQISNSYRFGLFLQKINLLKDQMRDLPEGRKLVPNREEMRQSLVADGQGAINYILNLPVERKDYRIFCAWSLFLGLASLPYIDQSWKEQKSIKIPRTKTLLILGKVELFINQNEKLKKLYNEMLLSNFKTLEVPRHFQERSRQEIWLYRFYEGRLTPDQMSELGLI